MDKTILKVTLRTCVSLLAGFASRAEGLSFHPSVSIGILEKEKHVRIRFRDWIGIGLVVGLATTATWILMTLFLLYYRS